jgi:hypothetical protein
MKNGSTFIFLTFWVIVAIMGAISGAYIAFHHPYLIAWFVLWFGGFFI